MFIAAGFTLTFLGCVTPPKTHLYTLDMTPSGKVHPEVTIHIESLRASEMLARRNLLIRKTPTEVEYYAGACWASAINELVSQKLQGEFGDKTKETRTVLVWGTLLECGQEDHPENIKAHLRLKLAFRYEGTSRYDTPLFEKTYDVSAPVVPATPDKVAATLTQCLEEVAVQIATDVTTHQTAAGKQGRTGNAS